MIKHSNMVPVPNSENQVHGTGTQGTKAFTLVELIVVITILAILGTIAFISLQGYSATSRDSVRIYDVSNMKTSLELFHLNSGKYPLPDDYGTVTYLGEKLFYQGYFGNKVIQNVSRNMNEIPTDPLTNRKYIYSIGSNKNELEILSLLETDNIALNTISQTNAAGITVIPIITGNYNGLFIKTTSYIVPLPSIINTEVDENTVTEITQLKIQSMVIHLGENIPSNGNVLSNTGALTGLVLTGALNNLTQDSTDAEKAVVIEVIQSAYVGEPALNSEGIIDYILTLEDNDTILAAVFDTTVLNETATVATVPSNSCDDATKPADDLNKTYTVNPTSVNQAYVQDSNECGYACISGYIGTNCETQVLTYQEQGLCNDPDIIIGAYTIASCNIGTIIPGTTSDSYGYYFQFGRNASHEDGTWTNGDAGISYDWEATDWVDGTDDGSANYWGVFEADNTTTTYLNPLGATDTGLMQGPCPTNYHVPTQSEWVGIHTAGSWISNGTGMSNALKMPLAGIRNRSDASLGLQGSGGYYWSSSPRSTSGYNMYFYSRDINPDYSLSRANGSSVRCFKN
ncbi:MAG: prepilin-type N-terminal cleavage/methylation domain-containing protein [Candidatus Gracilibacteria bacterium]